MCTSRSPPGATSIDPDAVWCEAILPIEVEYEYERISVEDGWRLYDPPRECDPRNFRVTFHLIARIVEMDRPASFVDEQVAGPFKTWRHEHSVESDGDRTTMVELIEYEMPFGPLGHAVDRLVLQRYLVGLIGERNAYIKRTAEVTEHATPTS